MLTLETAKQIVLILVRHRNAQALREILGTKFFDEPFIQHDEIRGTSALILTILLENKAISEPSKAPIHNLIRHQEHNEIFTQTFDPNDRCKVSKFTKALYHKNIELMSLIWNSFTAKQKASYCKKLAHNPTVKLEIFEWIMEHNAIPDFNGGGANPHWEANFHPVDGLLVGAVVRYHRMYLHTLKHTSTKYAQEHLAAHYQDWIKRGALISETHLYFRVETQEGEQRITTFGELVDSNEEAVSFVPFDESIRVHPHNIRRNDCYLIGFDIHDFNDENQYFENIGVIPIYKLLVAATHCNNIKALIMLLNAPESAGVDTIHLVFDSEFNDCVMYLLDRCFTRDHYQRLVRAGSDFLGDTRNHSLQHRPLAVLNHVTDPVFREMVNWPTINEPDCYKNAHNSQAAYHLHLKYGKMTNKPVTTIQPYLLCPSQFTRGRSDNGDEYIYVHGDVYVNRDGIWTLDESSDVVIEPIAAKVPKRAV